MNALIIPIFSMRSYETGQYAVLKDGNFQLMMSRVLASNFDHAVVAVPEDCSDFNEVLARFDFAKNVYFVKMKYGANAVATRDLFWVSNAEQIQNFSAHWFQVLITDITGYSGPIPVVYNFNITKLPELDRPYIDRFFETDLKSIESSLFTTVLNPRQREYILEVRPDLLSKVIVNTKCAHTALLPTPTIMNEIDPQLIFWPFRLSDKAYQWEQFLAEFERLRLHDQGFHVIVTDPNESATNLPEFVTRMKPSKREYYEILEAKPIVVMLDDIDTVLHPGTVEFFHYGCPVITYTSNLIPNPNAIQDLRSLGDALENLSYNTVDVSRFVYNGAELDSYYNKDFIDVAKN